MKTNCPNCGGHNFYVANGFGYCFNCEYLEREDGYIPQEKRRSEHITEIRYIYDVLSTYYHSCLSTEHRIYLHSRGIDDDAISRLRIGYCPNAAHSAYATHVCKEAGLYTDKIHLAGRITFPYFYENEVTDIQGRVFDVEDDRKYLFPRHSSYFRGADYAYDPMVEHSNDIVVITEGTIKAILSAHVFETYGLGSITLFRKIVSTPKKRVICFDNQRKHRRELKKSIEKAAIHYGANIATLPLYREDKQDIDSFILRHGLEEYKKVINNAITVEQWRKYA